MNDLRDWTPPIRLSALTTDKSITVTSTQALLGVLAGYVAALVLMVVAPVLPSILTVPVIVFWLSFGPGALLLLALGRRDMPVTAEHVLYALGSSLMILMTVGVLVNLLFPLVGVMQPLMPLPLGVGVTLAVVLLAAVARWRNPAGTLSLHVPPLYAPVPLALVLLPLLSIIGVLLINATGINVLLVVVLLAIGAVPFLVVRGLEDRWHSLAIWTVALAILYHKSLWQYAGFGGRPHGIEAWEAGRWSPGITSIETYTSELVQNGVLFPLFARLSDVFIMTQYEVVNPFFISFIPLALYVAFRQYVPTDTAFLGASVFAFVHPFYLQYPTAGRAATPVLFLALFGVTLSNTGLSRGRRAALAVTFLVGIVVTHYGTSYYVAGAFLAALPILYGLRAADHWREIRRDGVSPHPNGGELTDARTHAPASTTMFSLTTVFFFVTAALGWYLYTRGGWKFELLPKHVYENIQTLIHEPTVQGRTASRIQETYTSLSIEIAKYLYVILAILIVVGLGVVYYERIIGNERSFDDHYLTIGTAMFGIFGITILLRNWGGGRPMMITFSFTTVFAVLGAQWLATRYNNNSDGLEAYLPWRADSARSVTGRLGIVKSALGGYGFASLLMVLFILNTGIAAATVFGGFAPSNVPAQATLAEDKNPQSQVTVHRETDIVTHVWMATHVDTKHTVYGDTFAARQHDWYRPDITSRTPAIGGGYTPETKPNVLNVEKQRAGTQSGYLLIMGHNVALDALWPDKFGAPVPLESLHTDRQNRIYTTGESHVYLYSESMRPALEGESSENG